MKILVAGTGRAAKCTIDKLIAAGHTVVCGSRHPESIAERLNCKPVLFDLHAEKSEIAEIIKGFEAVYFLAGSRGKDLLQTDAFGAVKLMQAAETLGIRRFIMLILFLYYHIDNIQSLPVMLLIVDFVRFLIVRQSLSITSSRELKHSL